MSSHDWRCDEVLLLKNITGIAVILVNLWNREIVMKRSPHQQLPRFSARVLSFQLISIAKTRPGCGNFGSGIRGQKVAASAGLHRWGSPTARRPVVSDYYCGGFIPLVVNYTVHRSRVYVPARALSNISPGVHLQRILHRTGRKTGACAARLEIKSYRSSAPMNSFLFFFSRRPFSRPLRPTLSFAPSPFALAYLRRTARYIAWNIAYVPRHAAIMYTSARHHLEGMIRLSIPVWPVIHRFIDRCTRRALLISPLLPWHLMRFAWYLLHRNLIFTLVVPQKYRFFFQRQLFS